MSTAIIREDHAGVAHVQINRPEARNAIDDATARQLGEAFSCAEEDSSVRVILLSGTGRGFSAGLDLKAFAERGEVGEIPGRGFAGLTKRPPAKPIIAAVEGFALAGGFEIALACDMIVAAKDARFGLPEVKRGLVADGGSLLRLPERMPLALAMEIALLGDEVPVQVLYERGIVNRLVEPKTAVKEGLELAARIAANAPLATAAAKQILARSSRAAATESWKEQERIATPVWASEDAREGADAFAAKRDPAFRGK